MTDIVRLIFTDPIPTDEVRRLGQVLRTAIRTVESHGGDSKPLVDWMARLIDAMKLAGRSDVLS